MPHLSAHPVHGRLTLALVDTIFTRVELERSEADIADVERAIERLEASTYDRCEVCDISIAAEVKADPLVARCPAHPR